MAASFTVSKTRDLGNGLKAVTGSIDMDTTYATGGLALDLSDYFPGDVIDQLVADPTTALGYLLGHNGGTATSGKIVAYSGTSQVPNGTSLATLSDVSVTIFGH